ncbi:preprotein translocase subunit SecG [bacterium]|nr:MAG: preprotein translocase subunit SecG [bacterium]
MSFFLIIIHIIVSITLILIVLLQSGKGTDMGSAFGGGSSQSLFGSSGASTFLSKSTTIAAIIFMLTSLGLAYLSGHNQRDTIMLNTEVSTESMPAPAPEAPIEGEKKTPAEQQSMPAPNDISDKPEPETEQPVK